MKRYFSCFFFFFLFWTQIFNGQNINLTYEQLIDSFHRYEKNIDKQKIFAKEYLERGKRERNIERIAGGYYFYSFFFDDLTCFKYCDSAVEVSKNFKNDKFPMIALNRKTVKLIELNRYLEAIDVLLLTEKFALKFGNLDYYYDSKNNIGIVKSEYLGEYIEAISLYKESLKYFVKKKGIDKNYDDYYLGIIFGIADSYKSLLEVDSSYYYNERGYKEALELKSEKMKYLFVLNEGANHVFRKNYKIAIDSINKSIPSIIKNNDLGNMIAANFYYGKAYEGLKDEKRAVLFFKKVDSLYNIKGTLNPDFTDGYSYLINYYKKIGDKENQILYIDKFVKIDSVLKTNYKQLSKKLKNDYDIPHLMQEKETIIKGLHNDKKTNYWIIGLLGLSVVLSLVIMQHLTKQKKLYKQRFETLMQQSKSELLTAEVEEKQEGSADLGIPEDVVVAILKQLAVFENKKQYLKPNIMIGDLAITFETNSKYVSIVINAKKQKTFSNYINDLRIDHAVAELKNNKEMRKYTIAAIAEEVGFNTSESFSKAFFKRTGIKPSYFMKELILG
ncbi:helix-turn-helix domain-containing protein [Flavobacterium sp.]|uniref:helix-turn-helix domain-containing protein n=1 Tax=Flavobacterium sp. TaxID=239 RepID=UPI004047C310